MNPALPKEDGYCEAYKSKKCAYQREKNLKTYGSGFIQPLRRRSWIQENSNIGLE